MRFLTHISFFITTLLIISLTACYQDELVDNTVIVTQEPDIEIEETGVTGRAMDHDDNLLTEFEIIVNKEAYYSENNFYYQSLSNANKRGQFLFLSKNDQIIGLTNAYLIENDINNVNVKAFPERTKTALTSEIGITPEIILRTSGAEFTNNAGTTLGENILVNHSASSDFTLLNNLGTSARGLQNEMLVVKPQVAFYINVETTTGESLQFKENTGFTLTATQSADKGLFFLDDELDEWVLQSDLQSIRNGFYMMAEHEQGVYVEGEIIKEHDPVSFMSFNWSNNNYSYEGLSTSLGRWGSVVSQSSDISYDLESPCGDHLQNESLTSDIVPKENFSVVIDEDVENLVKVETKIFDCEGNIQTIPGLTLLNEDGTSPNEQDLIYLFNDADIDTWIPVCSNDFQLGGYNILDNENGPLINWSLNQNDEIEYLSNCQNFENGYSYIRIKDDMHVYEPFTVKKVDGDLTQVSEQSDKISLIFDGEVSGIYENAEVGIKIDDPDFVQSHGYYIECYQSGCGINEFNVTHYEETSNGWLRLSFSGTLWMLKTGTPNVAGNYDVEGVILCKL